MPVPVYDVAGYKFTAESGLDYFGARHYASTMGRFMQPDEFTGGPVDTAAVPLIFAHRLYPEIINPQSLSKYSYTPIDFLGKTCSITCARPEHNLSKYLVPDEGVFEGPEKVFEGFRFFQTTLRGRAFEILFGDRDSLP